MAWLLVEITYVQEKMPDVRPRHREFLSKLAEQGRVAVAGPLGDGTGGLTLYQADDEAHLDGFGPVPAELAREIVAGACERSEEVWLRRLYAPGDLVRAQAGRQRAQQSAVSTSPTRSNSSASSKRAARCWTSSICRSTTSA